MKNFLAITIPILLMGCDNKNTGTLARLLQDSPSIHGKEAYLESPYVTAGDRVYMVGDQDGTFPDMGWHIKGEMGGIWNHPIKLMDGFGAKLYVDGDTLVLDKASTFVNYPMANRHIFEFPEKDISVERWQFVPDAKEGVFIQFIIKNSSDETKNLDFEFTGQSDLRPTWLGERTQLFNGQDVAKWVDGKWVVNDANNNWFAVYGSNRKASAFKQITTARENTTHTMATYALTVTDSEVLNFVVAGSHHSQDNALGGYADIHENYETYAEAKKLRYAALAEQSKLILPDDRDLEQAFEWLKYNNDWLVRSVPEIGTGIGAGLPDYPWWFGVDSEYALKGYMAMGQERAVMTTIALLDSVSMAVNKNGKIIHEMSTNGAVFNPGNINETPQFASLVWEVYQWNGDTGFLKKYFPTIEKGLDWLLAENDANTNLFPDGFGMMEIHGLDSEMIDVAAYTQRAFDDAAKMAMELGKDSLATNYAAMAARLKKKINTEFWSEQFQSFADFLGTGEQALHLIEDAIIRADTLNKPWAVEELKTTKRQLLANPSDGLRPFVLHHNWVVNTPMEMGIADTTKALAALQTAKKFTNPFGVFVTGIDRDASAGKDFSSFEGSKVFSYTGAVMTLPTGVQAVAENNYGRPNQALDYLKRMTRTFGYALPGSMYEVSPDYGMMVQAWNAYAFAVPIVQQFFGVRPRAQDQTVVISPQMPSSWKTASLENVKIADNEVSIYFKDDSNTMELEIVQNRVDWTIQLELPNGYYVVDEGDFEITTTDSQRVFKGIGNRFRIRFK